MEKRELFILKKSSKMVESVILTVFISLFFSSCRSNGEENYSALTKVKKGMHRETVDSIMQHNPKLCKTAFWSDSLFVQYYDSPVGASDDLGIVFRKKDSIVVDIRYGD
jgi:hypothetical protein